MKKILFIFSFLVTISIFSQEEKRLALVIGNANYDKGALENPVNDANLIANTLDSLNFEVILATNIEDKRSLENKIREFGAKRSDFDVGFVYYAGHGVQINGENYLLPTKEFFESEEDIEYNAVAVSKVMKYLKSTTDQVNILVLDACRDNPFESNWNATRSLKGQGLAKIPPPTGSLIAFSTDAGNTAADGEGINSIYTLSLTKNMLLEDTSIDQVFRNVRGEVLGKTDGKQRPIEATQLTGQTFYLKKKNLLSYLITINDLISEHNLDLAFDRINELILTNPKNEIYLSKKIEILIKQNNNKEALKITNNIIIDKIKNEELLFQITETLIENEEYENAILNLSKLIEIDDKNSLYLRRLSYCYENTKPKNYRNLLKNNLNKTKLIVEKSNNYDDHYNLGYQYYIYDNNQSNKIYSDEIIKSYNTGLDIDNSKESALKYLKFLNSIESEVFPKEMKLENGTLVSAESSIKSIYTNYKDDWRILFYYSSYLLSQSFDINDDKEEEKLLQKVIKISSDGIKLQNSHVFYVIRGIARVNLSHKKTYNENELKLIISDAISDYNFALENWDNKYFKYGNKIIIPFYLSKLYQRNNDYEMQYNELKKSIKSYSEANKEVYERIYYDLAMNCYYLGKHEEGIEFADLYISKTKKDANKGYMFFIKAALLEKIEKFDLALETYIKSFELNGNGFKNTNGISYSSALINAFELSIYTNNLKQASEIINNQIIKNNNNLYKIFNSIIKKKKGDSANLIIDFNYDEKNSDDWYNLRLTTNYLHLLYLNKEFEKLIEICLMTKDDDGFLYILAQAYLNNGDVFNSILTTSKLIENIENANEDGDTLSVLDIDFFDNVDIEKANKLLSKLKSKLITN